MRVEVAPDQEVIALVYHAAKPYLGKVDQLRAKHLSDIEVPMLFIQGSRDTFGTPDELRPIIKKLKAPADLYWGRRRTLLQGLETRGYRAGRRL